MLLVVTNVLHTGAFLQGKQEGRLVIRVCPHVMIALGGLNVAELVVIEYLCRFEVGGGLPGGGGTQPKYKIRNKCLRLNGLPDCLSG